MVRQHDGGPLAPEEPVHPRERAGLEPVRTLDGMGGHAARAQQRRQRSAAVEPAHRHAQSLGDAGVGDRAREHLRAARGQRVHDLHHVGRHHFVAVRGRSTTGAATTRAGAGAARSTCSRSATASAIRKYSIGEYACERAKPSTT